jgi:DNA-binding NarL/FixJ family response regulator
MDISFMENGQENGGNNNEQILKLYKQGKSKIAIAKELGLGVGEVKLVIDLYKNM